MRYAVPGEVLKFARESADIRQGVLSKALDSNATAVSRLEKVAAVDSALAERYLLAIDTDLGRSILAYYSRDWGRLDPPSFLHPDREELWKVAEVLAQLDEFEASPLNHPILARTLSSLRDDLTSVLSYLERTDHVIAWVGDIGVGKTTALAFATKLLIPDAKGVMKSIFPVGSGRITISETVIKAAPVFGVAVEPLSEDAIRAYVQDLVANLAGDQVNVPAEIGRALRSMSGFHPVRTTVGDQIESRDPIIDALGSGESRAALTDRIVAAMDLQSRRETSLALSEDAEDGMQWLAKTVGRINSGQDARFSLPKRITVLVPSKLLNEAGELSIIDTKGVETLTMRDDLRAHLDHERTLVVLCTKFPDAPNATVQRVLRENVQAGSDSVDRRRVTMLVLSRNDEPLQVLDQGEPARSRAIGYAIRREEIEQALGSSALPRISPIFYDAHLDKPEGVWSSLRERISAMRGVHKDRLERIAQDVAELLGNVDLAKTRSARISIEHDFDRLIERIAPLPGVRRQAHQSLIEQMADAHQSSVAASMSRRGDWQNFPVLHILGTGVRHDANLRTADHFSRVEHLFEDIEQKYSDLADVRAMIGGLRDRMATWRQDFLAQTLSIGRDAFRQPIEGASGVWAEARNRYGTHVPGYKLDVADIWTAFFEGSEPDAARAAVESRLAELWNATIISPLKSATRANE